MADISSINLCPSIELINDIAIEVGVKAAFIEKDWFAVQAIKTIADYNYGDMKAVFAGGTCLSKGYDLIQRFSEDIDFRIDISKSPNRNQRRKFRQGLIKLIDSIEGLTIDKNSIHSNYESKFFSFHIQYNQISSQHSALRPYLKLEMTFNKIMQTPEQRHVNSIIEKYTGKKSEIVIDCVTPVETAADKFSALCWRIEVEDNKTPDPTLMRHLHDLCALQNEIIGNIDFVNLVNNSIQNDLGRQGSNESLSLQEKIALVTSKLETDSIYAENYENFVSTMFYGTKSERISFQEACQSYNKIAKFILSHDLKSISK